MADLIDRQAAVDALEKLDWYHHSDGGMVRGANSERHQAWYKADDVYRMIEQLPSPEPEIKDRLDSAYAHGYTEAEAHFYKVLQSRPEIIRCSECKHNPKRSWFGCPMSGLNERQRPETAWCWKGERENNGGSD